MRTSRILQMHGPSGLRHPLAMPCCPCMHNHSSVPYTLGDACATGGDISEEYVIFDGLQAVPLFLVFYEAE